MHHSPAVFLIIYILLLSQMLMVSSPSERIQWSQNLPFIFSGPISQTVRAPTVIYIYTHITHVNININMLTIFLTMTLTNHLLYHPLWLTNVSFLNGVSPVFSSADHLSRLPRRPARLGSAAPRLSVSVPNLGIPRPWQQRPTYWRYKQILEKNQAYFLGCKGMCPSNWWPGHHGFHLHVEPNSIGFPTYPTIKSTWNRYSTTESMKSPNFFSTFSAMISPICRLKPSITVKKRDLTWFYHRFQHLAPWHPTQKKGLRRHAPGP